MQDAASDAELSGLDLHLPKYIYTSVPFIKEVYIPFEQIVEEIISKLYISRYSKISYSRI